ncbi:MAG TPA: ABC transporter ATP-binding protein [Syntrophorhabdales bacterium]|nr:ABC transporter ATP-binding protein [Syntrophorhabdales bacterium]
MTELLFSARNLSFGYGSAEILHDVNVDVQTGEMVGIIGPNGAGKTTLLRLLSGYLIPVSGAIELFNKDLRTYEKRMLAQLVATLPQAIETIFPYTAEEFILMGRYPHFDKRIGYGRGEAEVVREVMERIGIGQLSGRIVNTLSEGERQKVYLAQCIAQDPKVLLLDEPVSHLDIRHQMQTLELLTVLNEKGLTILMILHDLNLASEFCSRILLLSQGKVFADGTPEATLTYQHIEEAYGTVVVVRENPLSGKPLVLPVASKYLKK